MPLSVAFSIVRASSSAGFTHLAHFQDTATVDALLAADPEVRAYLEASGFRIKPLTGREELEMEPRALLRQVGDLRHRLSTNYDRFDLAEANWNGFDLQAFIRSFDQRPREYDKQDAPNLRSKLLAGLFGFGIIVGSYFLAVAFGLGEGMTPLGKNWQMEAERGTADLARPAKDRPMETHTLD